MAVAVSYPGVYIDEFAPGGPIPAAGTNVAAILGPLAEGPLIVKDGPVKYPVKVTSFDQFKKIFGARPAPGFYTWYAVRGFFENDGNACYVYRVSNATYAKTNLTNDKGAVLGQVFALRPGLLDTAIIFDVKDPQTPLVPAGTRLYSATATGTITGSQITITSTGTPDAGTGVSANAFRVGDWVQISDAAGQSLGKMSRVKSVAGQIIVVDERYPDQAGAQLTLMYDSTSDLRIVIPPSATVGAPPVSPGTLTEGLVFKLSVSGKPVVEDVAEGFRGEQLTKDFVTYRVTTRNGLQSKIDPRLGVPFESITFDVEISQSGAPYRFVHLSSDPSSQRFYVDVINNYPNLVLVKPADVAPNVKNPSELRPARQPFSVVGGTDEELDRLSDNDFTQGLDEIRKLGDVRLVSIPDGYPNGGRITESVYSALIAHCEQMADRFAVIDPPPARELFGDNSIELVRNKVDSARGYAALYYPWISVTPAGKGPHLFVPPSGHICGLIARVDNTKGVFKAPANEILQGTIAIERTMTDSEHGLLNLQGINVIRVFRDGGRPYVYGARTTATDLNWNYVNVRRLFLFLEKSIQDGIRWSVFEPNNKALWSKLKQSISSFLFTQWQAGALFGDTPANAYYVRIDDALNSFEDQRQGRLNLEIGIRPTYPAEFVIVRIGIWNGGADVTEA